MIQIFFSLFFKVNYHLSLPSERVAHFQFGFLKDGSFNISVSDCSDIYGIAIALATKDELKKLQKEFPSTNDICFNNQNITGLTHLFRGKPSGQVESFSGSIPSKDIYTVIYQVCSPYLPFEFKAGFDFQNPGSKLDYRWNPVFKETPIFLALFGVELIIWLVNWIMHYKIKIGLHILITVILCLSVIIVGVRYGMFRYNEKYDSDNKFEIALLVFKSFFTFCIATLFLLAVKGWCILVHRLKPCEIVRATLYSAFFVVTYTLSEYLNVPFYVTIILLIAMIAAFVLFLYELFSSLLKSKNIIISRLCAYSDQGIDLKTTPFYLKYKMFNSIYILLYIYIMFQLISFTVLFILDQNYWIEYLTTDISNLFISTS